MVVFSKGFGGIYDIGFLVVFVDGEVELIGVDKLFNKFC